MGDTKVQERQPVGPTVVAGARPGVHDRLEYVELDEQVSEKTQPDVTVQGSWALKTKGRDRASSPVGPGPRPSMVVYRVGHDDTRGKGRDYVSTQGADVHEIGKSAIQSSHSDMIQIQPSQADDVLNDASISRPAYQESSYPGKGTLGYFSSPYEDTQDTDATMERVGVHSQAYDKTKPSDSFDRTHEAREKHCVERKSVPPGFDKLSQNTKDTESSVEASRKAVASTVYETIPVHVPSDAGYHLGKRENENFRPGGAADVNPRWHDTTHKTKSSTRQRYQVPLSKYLEPESDATGPLVTSRERKEDGLRQKGHETGAHHRNATEDSESIRVTRKFEEQEMVTNTASYNDVSKSTSPKQSSSVVSALLATACVAAVAFEAAAESRQKQGSQHTKVKRDESCDKVAHDRDSPVRTAPARIIEDNKTVTNEKNVAVNRTAQQTAVIDSLLKTVTTPTPAAVTLNKAQNEIRQSGSVDVHSPRYEMRENQKRVDYADSHPAVSAEGVRKSVRTTESTDRSVVAETRGAVSEQPTPLIKGRNIENVYSNQRTQTRVDSGRTVQASERAREETDVRDQATHTTQRATPRGQNTDTFKVEGGSTQHTSFDAIGVAARTSDKSAECSTRSEEQAIQEYKTAAPKCEVDQSLAQPSWTPALQEHTAVVVSPQVSVNVQQTVIVKNVDISQSTRLAAENQQGKQAETIARRSGGDSLSRDTERGSPSRSRSGSLQDDESTHLVESSRVESGQSSPKAVASGPSNLSSRSAAADARPFTEKTIPIPRQPAPTPIASRKQSGVTSSDTRSSIHSERGAGSHDGRSSTSRPNDVGHKGNHTERVENVEQTIHLQPRTQILGDADSDTTRCTLPSVEENSVVSSSRRSETSTETQSLGRSDRVPANERQLDRVSDVRNSSTVGFDDTTIVQKSAPSVRSGRVDQRTTPRRATTGDSSRSHVLPEKSRSMTQYSVGVEVDRTDVVRRSTVIETPLQEVNEVQEDVNDLHGYTGVSTLKAQTNSDATRSTEVSIDRTSTYSRSSETCIAENLSTQKSEKQARAERVDSKVDVQDTCEVQKLELTTYPRSLREASHRDSAQSIDKTSHSLAWSDRQTGRTDEKTSRQDEAMLTVGVTIGLIAVKEQHEVSVESPRIPLLTGNTSTSSPVTTDGTAGPSSEIKHDQPPEGVVRVPIDGNVARTRNPSPSGSNSAFSQSDTHLMLQRNDTGLVDRRADSVVSSVTAESHPQTKEMPGARRNTTVIPAASSEQCSEAAEHIQIALDGKETRAPLSNTSYESVKLSYKLDVEEDHEHLDGDIDGDEESERMQAEAEIQLSREHSPAQMTSEKAFMQSDAHMILQLDDARLVDKHADSVVLSAIAESHAQTKEMHGARRNTTVDLAASSEQRSEAAKRIQIALDDEETRVPLTRTSDETIKLSCKSDVEMHHGHVNEDIDSERTADTSLSASHLTSTRDDESRVKSITESRGILHPLARGQSLDLAIVKQSKEDLLSGSQVHTSSVLEPGLATTDENTTFAQGIEDDVVRLSTSLEVSATTAGTSLTTSAHPAEATADRSNDDDSTSIATKKSGISSVVSTPHSSPRSSTSLASVPASDRQTTLSAAQITGCVVESASAVVVGAAGVQLSKEFICGDTSSTKVIQQQTISGSKELTARTQEKYDIHEQATSSEYETISFNGYSDCYTSSRDNDKTAIQPTRTPRQNSIECEQQVAQLVQPTSQQRKSAQMQGVSNVGLESRSKSMSKERLRTENTEMAKLSTTTTSEPSPRQTVKGVAGSLHLDIESHSTESIRSSRRSVDGDDSPSDLQQPLSVDGKFPAQSPHDSHSSLSESRPISRAEIIGNVSRSFLHSPGNLSPAILYASPIDFSGSEAGTAASPIDEIHGTVAEEDDVEFEEERASASPVHTNNSSMVPIKGGEPRTRSDVHPDQRVAYSPASSLSPSPLTSAVGGEASIGKPADHIGENNDSGGQFTVPASSSLAQEERTQSALEVNSDHEWQINIQWIPDNKEPPPSYEDAVSDYDNSPIGPSDALSGDDRQSMRQYTQYYGDDKSSTLNVTSDEFQRRSEEGASALEWHWNPQATCPKNDSDVGESVPLPVEAEDALRTHQEIMNEGVSWASETDEERVLDQHIGVVPRECANTVHESSSQFFTDTRSANRFHPAANGSPSSQLHSSDATSAHDDVDAPSSYEVRREVLSSERSTSQEYVCVVRSDEDRFVLDP
ncbi:hypothetical protein HD554DRAFT_2124861 [Boletus coccyginus]|nr:hypothetical protein HD554DRAFT_2124861 [Boletus coccyginus]